MGQQSLSTTKNISYICSAHYKVDITDFPDKGQFAENVLAMCTLQR